MLEKATFSTSQEKQDWSQIMKIDVMSSEESGEEGGEEVIVSRPLPWLSANVTQFFRQLDDEGVKRKSPQAKRQMKTRKCGLPSTRPKPTTEAFPSWEFCDDED